MAMVRYYDSKIDSITAELRALKAQLASKKYYKKLQADRDRIKAAVEAQDNPHHKGSDKMMKKIDKFLFK
jgi:hypothetical protein